MKRKQITVIMQKNKNGFKNYYLRPTEDKQKIDGMLNFLKMKRKDTCLHGHWEILKPYPIHKRYFASLVDAVVFKIKQNILASYSN